ncbi:helix-turn-helix domain-containing protein [Amycolatopsis vancoresmycina]|uniref:HTH cro/C1-type domain-containing protein n=1 Tax=Amycolatopsis vancoresmycina DSM 44592 TaxID=1292037 RepID=R1HZ87_9PSEU|nr:helix-turn-helix transcriptional regulator [Amycolatopsis vancoresmycina]EOD65616.1 hypothetical protein H480_25820 [Amycolatopsis vancoresmycina DSM 44592]
MSETVGAQVRAIREARGMKQRELVDACAAAGWNISASTIENIEGIRRVSKGEDKPRPRREISVDELLALAVVLGVHPIDLLIPGDAGDDELVTLPPGLEVTAGQARAWIAGTGFLEEPADLAELAEVMRRVPTFRAAALNAAWWTPERLHEQQRLTNAALRADEEARSMAPEGDEAPGRG